ncbi:MAG: hypothetical protein K2H96_00825 [Muribaculaceae bacterium]|nr:hypothetical protein [Muribaculaceae bacterium]
MKKLLTLAIFLAACSYASADELTVFRCGDGIPGIDEPQLMGLGISPQGKYVCGAIEKGAGIFVANVETGEVKWTIPEGDEGGELRHVDDNGLSIGVSDRGILFSFDSGLVTDLVVPEGTRYILGEDLTNSGKMLVGSLSQESFRTYGAYTYDAENWTILPLPTKQELGSAAGRVPEGSAAKMVSADGKVIYGALGSYTLPMLWVMNDKGEFESDFFIARYLADGIDPNRPVYGVNAIYGLSLSNNGRYATFLGAILDEESDVPGTTRTVPMVYDVQEKELKIYSEKQPIDEYQAGLWPIAIADDGTFIGTIGMAFYDQFGSFIMKAGETVAETYLEAFPAYAEKYSVGDYLGFNQPCAISASGRYILGYIYYCEDYNDAYADDYYETYIIDRGEDSAVNEISSEEVNAVPEAIYSIDGKRLSKMTKGLNIIRMSDGSARKVINK